MIYVFYRPTSEHERLVTEFFKRLEKEKLTAELIDINSQQGAAKAEAYGLMRFPSVLAVRVDGSVIKDWQGDMLPTVADVAFFARGNV